MSLPRRAFLQRSAVLGAATALPLVGHARRAAALERDPELAPFFHGVASGDPLADRVVLWTRVTPPAGHDGRPVPVRWVVARDPALRDVVASGTEQARPERDFTVKVDPTGLAPRTTYFYGFRALGRASLTGRTRTAPTAGQAVDRLRFAVVSCSNVQAGFFNAYARIAERDDLDAVIHLGDYLYEYPDIAADPENGYGPGAGELSEPRPIEPPTEMVTLDDYRLRHGTYKLDPDLIRLHQRHPMIATWDDHESTNNSHRDGAGNHQPDAEGDWEVRKRASARAYDEWMPLRLDDPSEPLRIYRTLSYGDLADIVVMDTRLEGRDPEVGTTGATILSGSEIDDPDRQMISPAQRDQVHAAIRSSSARWKVVAQQVVMAQVNAGGLPSADAFAELAGQPDMPAFFVRDGGNALNPDQWDGYTAERERFFANVRDHEVDNLVVLTGDIHTSWAIELTEDPYNPLIYDPTGLNPAAMPNVGVEFVTPSITSANFETLGRELATAAAEAAKADNPHVRYLDLVEHGYLVLDLDEEGAQADFYFVDTVLQPSPGETFATAWRTADGANRLQEAAQPRPDGAAQPRPDDAPPVAPGRSEGPAGGRDAAPAPAPAPAGPSLPATGGGRAALALGAITAAAVLRARSGDRTTESA